MAGVKPVSMGPWIKGVDASTSVLAQPKGSIPRGSNLILSKRGSLRTCDGSSIVDAFNGVATSGRGRAMAEFFFQPTGVAGYYLRIMAALDQPLGAPKNLTAALLALPGTLTVGQAYYWVVTAVDGAGGETTASNEATATPTGGNQSVSLTWNQVPNAYAYNIYRGTTSGGEVLLIGTGLPVTTNAYIDTGAATPGLGSPLLVSVLTPTIHPGTPPFDVFTFALTTAFTPSIGSSFVYTAGSNPGLNGVYKVTAILSSMVFTASGTFTFTVPSTGGTLASAQVPPVVDTTQQTALYAMTPAVNGISYTDANIVALFPAAQAGGTATQGYSPSGGVQGSIQLCPMMVQFTNQAVLALGNGFRPQVYSDPNGTPTNPATSVPISAISVDANGVVTITTSEPHNINPVLPPSNYNSYTLNVQYQVGDIVVPDSPNGYYYTCTVAGESEYITPPWPLVVGQTWTAPNNPTWINSGALPITLLQGVGANVVLSGITNAAYNTNGNGASAFVTISTPTPTSVTIVNPNAIGQGASSGGTLTVSTIPVVSTFIPAFPVWTTAVSYAVNSIIEPVVSNGYYYKALSTGISGASEPSFPTGIGATVADGSVTWQNAGTLASAAPPPPGCGHMAVYSGSLWMFDTGITNTGPNSNTGTGTVPIAPNTNIGLDGPCSLRMCDVNNLQSWNPINQAFLDKDDGTEGMGLGSFTISAQGIPPEGSLCAFKRRAVYQIIGVFGADNFAIQRVQSDMGILAPRTLQFVPGFGLARLTYLGIAVFDSVNDRIVSTQVEPYLIGSNDPDLADITPMDPQWQTVAQSALTAIPPMYCTAIPVGVSGMSNGQLTRILCFDLVLKGWGVVNLPFPISTMLGVITFSTVGQTVVGSWNDGTLQQWQSGAVTWATSVSGSNIVGQIAWAFRSPTMASKDADERLFVRRLTVSGQQTAAAPSTMTIKLRNGGVVFTTQSPAMPTSGDFSVQSGTGENGVAGRRFDAIISGVGMVTVDTLSYHIQPRPVGILSGAIA